MSPRKELKPGEDWDFFAGFNASTEAYRTLKRVLGRAPISPAQHEFLSRELLAITDQCQELLTQGEVDRASLAHARTRIALHHVIEWSFDKVPETAAEWADWHTRTVATVARLLLVAQRVLEPAEELPPAGKGSAPAEGATPSQPLTGAEGSSVSAEAIVDFIVNGPGPGESAGE